MSPMQNDQLARTLLSDRRRDAARWHTTPARPGRLRAATGGLLVGAGQRLDSFGHRLQRRPTELRPCIEPC